ncbi:type II secretion system protein GspM [Marinibaculum pumilum]|uniref:Type II secretion system protein GspM n=1 Tax=Marinibaculum pumilum TaxID=1766165 RepID=A0ABV7L1E8_9PROT
MDGLSKPVRRALALAILVAIPLLAWLLVISPLAGMVASRQAAIAAEIDRLNRLDEVASRIPGLQRLDKALADRLKSGGEVWEERSDTVVSANMETLVRGIVEKNGGSLASSSPLPTRSEQEFKLVRVRFKMSGPLDMVEKTLEAVAQARPALFVEGFQIEVPANASPPDKPPVLNLDLDVMGYLQEVAG